VANGASAAAQSCREIAKFGDIDTLYLNFALAKVDIFAFKSNHK